MIHFSWVENVHPSRAWVVETCGHQLPLLHVQASHVVSTARRGNSARGRGVHPNTFLLTTLALKRIQHLNWPALTPLSLLPPQTDRTRRKPTEPGFPTNEAKKLSKFHSSHELALPGARRASPAPGGEVNRHKSILSEERPFYLHWASLLQLYSKQTCLRLAIC